MQASAGNMDSVIFVTHVEAMGSFLKVCGQISRSSMDEVESTLRRMHVLLLTHRLEPELNEINSTDIYLVQANAEALFRRCNVLNVKRTGEVRVLLIDYGQELDVHVSQIQMVMDSHDGSTLLRIPPQLHYGILAGVYIKDSQAQLHLIHTQLRDVLYTYRIEDQINKLNIITLMKRADGQMVSDSLILQSLAFPVAVHIQLQELRQFHAIMPSGASVDNRHAHFAALEPLAIAGSCSGTGSSLSSPKSPATSRGLVASRPLSALTQYTIARQQSETVVAPAVQPQTKNSRLYLSASRPLKLITTHGSSGQLDQHHQQQQQPDHQYTSSSASSALSARNSALPPRNLAYRPSIAIAASSAASSLSQPPANDKHSTGVTPSSAAATPTLDDEYHTGCHMPTFSSNTLLIKSQHTVTVAYVEDGPSLFSIHLQAQEHDLDEMMSLLGNYPLRNLTTKPALGMACVARNTADRNLYRAVIMNIRPTTCLVAYVDYGITGDVPFSQLFQIPAFFLRHQIFAMRFTLSGYQQLLPLSRELDQLFRDLVMDAELQLVVRPLDGPPCVQYCELYARGGRLNVFDQLLALRQAHVRQYTPALALRDNEMVIVRCIENAKHFYVQAVRNLQSYEGLMLDLQVVAAKQSDSALAPIRLGEPCMVWHTVNKEWNRAEVIEVLKDDVRTAAQSPPNCLIRYVDMGSVDEARPDEVRHLDDQFLVLPRQSVECCLESFADVANVSKSTLDQMEMLADMEDGRPRTFKVNIYATLADPRRQALVVNLIDTNVRPILDLSQRVFMMCMPQREFRAYEQQRAQRLTSAAAAAAAVASTGKQHQRVRSNAAGRALSGGDVLNSTQLDTPEQSPDSTHTTEVEVRYGGDGQPNSKNEHTQPPWEQQQRGRLHRSSSPINATRSNWRAGGGRQQEQQHQQIEEQVPLQRRSTEKVATKVSTAPAPADISADDRQTTKQQQKRDKKAYGSGSNRHLIPRFNKQNRKDPSITIPDPDDIDTSGNFSQSNGSSTSDKHDTTPITIAPAAINLDDPVPRPSTITHWKSPSEFYVQCQQTHGAYVSMMQQLQNDYRQRVGGDVPLVAGTFVVARKPQGFFRAQLVRALTVSDKDGLELLFIDTGDRAALQPATIWPMDRCFGQHARFAVRCCLSDVAQLADKTQIARRVEKYVDNGQAVHTVLLGKQQQQSQPQLMSDNDGGEWDTYRADVQIGTESLKQMLIHEGLLTALPDGVVLACLVGQTIVIDIRKASQQQRITGSIFGCKNDQELVFASSQPIAVGAKHVTVHVDGVNDENVLSITPLNAPPAFLVGGLLSAPLLAARFTVQIVQVDSANVLHLQNVAHADDGDRLINDMFVAYDKAACTPLTGPLRTRQLCAGRSTADDNWYRCIIERVPTADQPLVTVRYIDYGNCEQLPRDHLRQLLDKYQRPDALAMRCYLMLRGTDELATAARVASLTDGLALELTVLDQHAGHCIVDISSRGRSLVNVLGDSGLAESVDVLKVRAQIDEDVRRMQLIEVEDVVMPEEPAREEVASIETPSILDTALTMQPTAEAVVPDVAAVAAVATPTASIYDNRIECYLSHTDRPDRFYLRRLADEPALNQMQENIQIVAPSLPTLDDYRNGTQCIVKYSGDDLWYRAAIIDSGSGITSVLFIDYGNTDTITEPSLLKAMDAAFQPIRPYAIPCMLPLAAVNGAPGASGTATPLRTEWPEEACQLMRGLLDERLAFEYRTTGASCSVVSLWAPPDRDVSLELIQAGFARPVPFIPDGQPAFVSHVNSLEDFYVQMAGETNSLEIVADYLHNIEQFAELHDCAANTICTALYSEDNGWYRARILRPPTADDKGAVEVVFIDYGNTSTVRQLRVLPANIAQLPHLSRQCALQRPAGVAMWSDEAERRFVEIANDGETVFTVQLVMPSSRASTVRMTYVAADGETAVDLSTELAALCDTFDLADVDVLSTSMMSSCSIATPAATAKAAATVTQAGTVLRVKSSQNFLVRLDVHRVQLEAIASRMAAESADWPKVCVMQAGDLCAARSPRDGLFHRAVIAEISSDDQHLCHLFDEGLYVRSNDLRMLPADLAEHSQCFEHCQIAQLPADELAASKGPVIAADDRCHVRLVDGTVKPHLVALYADAEGQRQCFELLPTAEEVQPTETVVQAPALTVVDATAETVETDDVAPADAVAVATNADAQLAHATSVVGYLTFIHSAGAFWMQPDTVSDQFNAIVAQMASMHDVERMTAAARVGDLCAAKFADDELFYRAEVLTVEPDGYQVKFIDYGNTATTSHLCELPAELAAIPPLATHCALAPTTTSTDDVVAATLDEEEFAELLAAEGETAYHFDLAESGANGATTVRMFRDAERTQEIRVRATAVEPQPSAAVPEPLPAGSDFSGLVSWTNSPLDFFVQPTHLSGSLIELTERLESAPAIGHLVNPTVGQLCAAKFVDDGMFYRARILSEESNTNGFPEYQVLFVDFGNEAVVTDIRVLPDELQQMEFCAVACALQRQTAAAVTTTMTENEIGDALSNCPSLYQFRVTADNRTANGGRLLVRVWTDEQRTVELLLPAVE